MTGHILLSVLIYGSRRDQGDGFHGGVHFGGALVRNRRHGISAVGTVRNTLDMGCRLHDGVVKGPDVARCSRTCGSDPEMSDARSSCYP